MSGEACEFPFEFDGQTYDDCVDVVGSEMCVVSGLLQECKPLTKPKFRTTIDGRECLFPFSLLGQQYHDCTIINGIEACMIDGGLSACAPAPTPTPSPIPQQESIGQVQDNASVEESDRMTEDGRKCVFPFMFMEVEYDDCTEFMDEEWCLLDESWAKCVPRWSVEEDSSVSAGESVGDSAVVYSVPQDHIRTHNFASIAEAISNVLDLATLLQSFYLTNLIPFISDQALQVTILAPTNAAFKAFLQSQNLHVNDLINHPDMLYQILLYHIIPLSLDLEDVEHALIVESLLEDYTLTVEVEVGEQVKIVGMFSEANVVMSNIKAGQARIHIIDSILLPSDAMLDLQSTKKPSEPNHVVLDQVNDIEVDDDFIEHKSVQKEEMSIEDLTIFMELAEAAEIKEIVQGDLNGLTLFVPTNEAFTKLFLALEQSYEEVLSDKKVVREILQYHMVPQSISYEELTTKLVLPTFLESKMLVVAHYQERDITTIRGIGSTATLTSHNGINAAQGIIHVVDTVLLPFNSPEVMQRLQAQVQNQDQGQEHDDSYLGILERVFSPVKTLFR